MTKILGKVKRIKVRDIWKKEDKNFTRWLAEAENLEDLGEAIGMSLELEGTEIKVGSFSADIVCKNNSDKSLVVIENQLEKTDHDHLGKVITYGAGLDALTMIWVTPKFRKEHRNALKWLNENTNTKLQFFGIEIELLKIGDSLPAPKFSIVCKPDGHSIKKKREKQKKSKGALTATQILQESYWQGLKKYLIDKGSKLSGQDPRPKPTQWFKIGRSGAGIRVKINIAKGVLRLEIYLNDKKTCKAFFNLLHKDKKAIQKELDYVFDWQEFPEKAYSSIGVDFKNIKFKDKKDWNKQYSALKFGLEKLDEVFTHRILALDPSDWKPTAKK